MGYWQMVAENVAKGLGANTLRRLGVGGRILGRAGAVAGIGFMVYEMFKSYKENIEKEPAYQEMTILQEEMTKWGSAISCLGREAYQAEAYGDLEGGGAINALYAKQLRDGKGIKPPETAEAAELIQRAIDLLKTTENLAEDEEFEMQRQQLMDRLDGLRQKIDQTDDYAPIQAALGEIVAELMPIESGYSARIYECSRKIQKTLGSNAAWAALSMVTLGLVKKPSPERANG